MHYANLGTLLRLSKQSQNILYYLYCDKYTTQRSLSTYEHQSNKSASICILQYTLFTCTLPNDPGST